MRPKLNFGEALELMKDGKKVTRRGWQGGPRWVTRMSGMLIPPDDVSERTRVLLPKGEVELGGYLTCFTAHEVLQPGWLPSQQDLLSNDWFEVTAAPSSD